MSPMAKTRLAAAILLATACGFDSLEGAWSTSLTCSAGAEATATLSYSFDGIDQFERRYAPDRGTATSVSGRYAFDRTRGVVDLDNCLEGRPPACDFRPMETWTDVSVSADSRVLTFQAANHLTSCLKGNSVTLTLTRSP